MLLNRITAAERRALPASEFALPLPDIKSPALRAKVRRGGFAGAYPMDTRGRGQNARSRAIQMLNKGYLSLGEARTIFARTTRRYGFNHRVIERVGPGRYLSRIVGQERLRGAANKKPSVGVFKRVFVGKGTPEERRAVQAWMKENRAPRLFCPIVAREATDAHDDRSFGPIMIGVKPKRKRVALARELVRAGHAGLAEDLVAGGEVDFTGQGAAMVVLLDFLLADSRLSKLGENIARGLGAWRGSGAGRLARLAGDGKPTVLGPPAALGWTDQEWAYVPMMTDRGGRKDYGIAYIHAGDRGRWPTALIGMTQEQAEKTAQRLNTERGVSPERTDELMMYSMGFRLNRSPRGRRATTLMLKRYPNEPGIPIWCVQDSKGKPLNLSEEPSAWPGGHPSMNLCFFTIEEACTFAAKKGLGLTWSRSASARPRRADDDICDPNASHKRSERRRAARLERSRGKANQASAHDVMTSLRKKLHPSRFPGMSPMMASIVGMVVGEEYATPALVSIRLTRDGHALARQRGDTGFNVFLGSADDLAANWFNLIEAAELGPDEIQFLALRMNQTIRGPASKKWMQRLSGP